MCDFPSKQLLEEKRRIANLADSTVDPHKLQLACEFCLKVDQLRLLHEDLTGCECWYAEVRKIA